MADKSTPVPEAEAAYAAALAQAFSHQQMICERSFPDGTRVTVQRVSIPPPMVTLESGPRRRGGWTWFVAWSGTRLHDWPADTGYFNRIQHGDWRRQTWIFEGDDMAPVQAMCAQLWSLDLSPPATETN